MIQDVIKCLYAQGFRKIILLLAHGGIFIAGPAIRELNLSYPDLSIIKLEFMQFFSTALKIGILECDNNLHACEFETSLMLHLRPETVHMDLVCDSIPQVPREFLNYAPVLKISPCGVWGKPSLASAEKGEQLYHLIVRESLAYIEQTFTKLEKL